MLTPQDIKKITEYQKEVFVTKDEFYRTFDEFNNKFTGLFSTLQTSVDAIALDNRNFQRELATLNHRVKNTENWIPKASPKLGIKFNR